MENIQSTGKSKMNFWLKYKSQRKEQMYQDWRRKREKWFFQMLIIQSELILITCSIILLCLKRYQSSITLLGCTFFIFLDYALWTSKEFHSLGGCLPKLSCVLLIHMNIVQYDTIFISPAFLMGLLVIQICFLKVSTSWITGVITEILTCSFILLRMLVAQKSDLIKLKLSMLIPLCMLFVTGTSILHYSREKSSREIFILLIERQKQMESLKTMYSKLAKEMKHKEEFFACMSHELRNPLNSILGNIELLEQGKVDIEIIDSTKLCGQTLQNLIGNILEFSKLEQGKMELNISGTDIREKVANVITMFKNMAEKKGLFLRLISDEALPPNLQVDSHRFIQVMINFVANALKFTQEGGITINISWIKIENEKEEKENKKELIRECLKISNREQLQNRMDEQESLHGASTSRIMMKYQSSVTLGGLVANTQRTSLHRFNTRLKSLPGTKFFALDCIKSRKVSWELEDLGDQHMSSLESFKAVKLKKGIVKIEVIDTGIGINKEDQNKLFQPFKQATSTTSLKYGGTGLGLWISKKIICSMGGEVEIESSEGEGANFLIGIPVISSLEEKLNPQTSREYWVSTKNLFEGLRVLVCEDFTPNHLFMSTMLNHLGMEATIVVNGERGLHQYMTHPTAYFHCIITRIYNSDLRMAVMSGGELIQKIREIEGTKNNKKEFKSVNIIVISGDPEEDSRKRCLMTLRASDFLSKPFTYEDLINSFKKLFYKEKVTDCLYKSRYTDQRILIIEDDMVLSSILSQFLKSGGYTVFHASQFVDVKKYETEFRTGNITYVTLDSQLKDSSGQVIAKYLRHIEGKYTMKIISISGDSINLQKENYKNVYIDSFLQKPVSRDRLLKELYFL